MTRPEFDHLAIRASAGTGKTFRLTNRFIALLAAGAAPETILAVTFTRKAAGEISRRVLLRLAQAGIDAASVRQLAGQIGVPDLSSERCRQLLRDLIRRSHRLSIGTLDGFFVGVAKAFSLELGLPPGWSIASEIEDADQRDRAVADVLAADPAERLIELMRLMHGGEARRGVADQIRQAVGRLHELYLEAPDAGIWNWLVPPAAPSEQALQQAVAVLNELPIPQTKAGKPNQHWAKAIQAARAAAAAGDWRAIVCDANDNIRSLTQNILNRESTYSRTEISEQAAEVFSLFAQVVRAVDLQRLAGQNRSTHELLQAFHRHYSQRQLRAHRLQFSDVTRLIADCSGDLSRLYYRLDGRVHHLLLDEFQDTSRSQWRVLEPMALEITSQADTGKSFFCVGDVKQAIYGWRGGEAALMAGLRGALHETVREEPLDESHRSSPVIMNTVNAVFGGVAENPVMEDWKEAAMAWARGFHPHRSAARVADRIGHAELLIARESDGPGSAGLQALRDAAALAKDLFEQAPQRSIGLLVRKNGAVARLIFELRCLGVMASEEGGNPLTDAPAVSLVLSLLRLADHPADTVARFHVARSPLGAVLGLTDFTDDSAAAGLGSDIRRRLVQDGYGPVVMGWVERLAPACDSGNLRRLLQLADLARTHDAAATLRPVDFIRLVRQRRVEDPTSAVVRVMTVHQAKGLEFDAVILPELDVRLTPWKPTPHALTDRPDPAGRARRISLPGRKSVRSWSEELLEMGRQHEQRAIAETLSLLYVAMTRPVHALYLIAQPTEGVRSQGDTWADLLTTALTGSHERPLSDGPLWTAPGGDPFWAEKTVGQTQLAVDAGADCEAGSEIHLAPPPEQSQRRLKRRSASSQEGHGAVRVSQLLDIGRARALERGTQVHAMCQAIGWLDEEMPDRTALLAAAGRSSADMEQEADALLAALQREPLRSALSRPGPDAELLREEPFAYIEDGRLVSGAFDRLVRVRSGGRIESIHVLDFKTDRLAPGSRDEHIAFYRPQMLQYRLAAAAVYGVDPGRVSLRLLFIRTGEVIDVQENQP